MALYSDNANRAQRVADLVNDISFIQTSIVGIRNQMKTNEARAYEYLKKVSQAAGYPTPDAYVENALKMIPESERKKFEKLKKKLMQQNKDCGTALDVLGGVAALCIISGRLLSDKSLVFFGLARQVVGERVVAEAVAEAVEGTLTGAAMAEKSLGELLELSFEWSPEAVEAAQKVDIVLDETLVAGAAVGRGAAEGAQEAAVAVSNVVKFARVASKVVGALAVLATIGLLIYEGIEGAKQKEKLQAYTLEYQAKRFSIQKTHLLLQRASGFMMNCMAMLLKEDTLNDLIKDGTITEETKKKKMKGEVQKTGESMRDSLKQVKDTDVYKLTKAQDQHSWTNEDHSEAEIETWLKNHKTDST